MMGLLTVHLFLFGSIIIYGCQGGKFSFTHFEYVLDETDGSVVENVELQRMLENGESPGNEIVELVTGCPADCPKLSNVNLAKEGNSRDFTFTNPSFIATSTLANIPIVITDDSTHEMREYFCLRVKNAAQRGRQWYVRITIPWNDYCTRIRSHAVIGPPIPAGPPCACGIGPPFGYLIDLQGRFGYVGPWNTQLPVDFHIFSNDNQDVNIFMTEGVDYYTFEHYDLFIDDSASYYHTSEEFESEFTVLTRNGPTPPLGSGTIIDAFQAADGHYLAEHVINSFTLTYIQQTGTVSLTPTTPLVEGSDPSPTPLNIDNLFVLTASGYKTRWDICGPGLDPKNIPIENAVASGENDFYDVQAVYDNDPASYLTLGSCFVSDPDDDGNHWLELDLGREFHVKSVVIYTINDGANVDRGHLGDMAMNEFINNAQIYVGNCRSEDHSTKTSTTFSNLDHVCNDDIGTVADMGMVQVQCDADAYGRYVYLVPSPTSTDPLTLCEIEVFGDEVPFVDASGNPIESRVEFSASTHAVSEGDATVSVTLTRTGERQTCTYVSYFTDYSPGDADITSVSLFDSKEVMFNPIDDSITISIDITQDTICEDIEKYNVSLYSIEGGRFGYQHWTTLEITDDDARASYTLKLPTVIVSENDDTLQINIDKSTSDTLHPVQAILSFTESTNTNTASSNDFNSARQVLTFPTSSTTESIMVAILDDECYEDQETFSVSLALDDQDMCSFVGSPDTVQITLTDNDSFFRWNTMDSIITVKEGDNPFEVSVTRQGTSQDKNIEFIVGHITSDSDDLTITPSDNRISFNAGSSVSSQVVTIRAKIDNQIENTEVFLLRLVDPLGSSCPNGNREHPYLLKFQILDNDGVYYWKSDTVSVSESLGEVLVCLLRTDNLKNAQTVEIISAGVTATSEVDFFPINQISFESDETEKCVSITIAVNVEREATEFFTLTIAPGQTNVVVGSPDVATVRIIDSIAPEIGWEADLHTFIEGTVVTLRIIKMGGMAVEAVITPSTTDGLDFITESLTINIPADVDFYEFELNILDDDFIEPTEVFTLTLSEVSFGSIGNAVTTINILDNNIPPAQQQPPAEATALSTEVIAGASAAAVVGVVGIAGALGVFLFTRGAGTAATTAASATQLVANTLTSNTVPLGIAQNGVYYVGNNGVNNIVGLDAF